jgi:hypothetical protein
MDGNTAPVRCSDSLFFNILKFIEIIRIIDYHRFFLFSDETRMVTTGTPDRMIFYTLDCTNLYRFKVQGSKVQGSEVQNSHI